VRGQGRIGAPFCYQTLGALEAIRREFGGQRRYVALAIYVALCELANEHRHQDPRRRGFRAERKVVADRAGTSPNTVSGYLDGLQAAGVLLVEREQGEAYDWELTEPEVSQETGEGVPADGTPPSQEPGQGLTADGEGVSQQTGLLQAGAEQALRSSEEPEEQSPSPPRAREADDPREPKAVDKKRVTTAEHDLCDAVLAAFNEATGKDFQGPDARKGIIGRLRERPDLDLAAHRELIARTLASPWWEGSPSPAVIYGNSGVFERCLNESPDDRKDFEHQRTGDLSAYDRGRK
jgi:hypothetical protein